MLLAAFLRSQSFRARLNCAAIVLTVAVTNAQPLDPSFNPNANSDVFALAAQPDGKILVGGNFTMLGDTPRSRLARLNPDGSIDATFNPSPNSNVNALAVQPDGRILVGGGFTTIAGIGRIRLARLHPDGSIDPTFTAGADSTVFTLAVQADGKILAGGLFSFINNNQRRLIARMNSDGSLDQAFAPVLASTSNLQQRVDAIAVQPSGKIIVGGSFTSIDGITQGPMTRLNADGSKDFTFLVGLGATAIYSIVLQADNRILVGGSFSNFTAAPRRNIVRLDPNSGVSDGQVGLIGPNTLARVVLPQADGKFIIGGPFVSVGTEARRGIARFNADGSLDLAFDPDITGSNGPSTPGVYAMVSPAPGQVIIGGTFSSVSGQPRNGLARLGWPLPSIVAPPRSQTFATGQPLTLSVSTSGVGVTYQWLRNGVPLPGATNATLALAGADPSNAGSYTVTASNLFGSVTSPAASVTVDPRTIYIATAPASRSVTSGTDVTLSVVAGGRPAVTYQWRKDGVDLPGETRASLALGFAVPEHSGSYVVEVRDASGSLTAAPAVLSVLGEIPYLVSTLAGRLGRPGFGDGPSTAAQLFSPNEIAVDASGSLYFTDREAHTVRKVDGNGFVRTLAGRSGTAGFADGRGSDALFNLPTGIAVDRLGNVFVADTNNNRIRKITPAGVVTTFAGDAQGNVDGIGAAARFALPNGLAIDSVDNLYCTDGANHTIRKITPGAEVTLVAGLARSSGHLDGAGVGARFNTPTGIAVDRTGMLYVADTNNHVIRRVAPDGVVTTLVGEPGISAVIDGAVAIARLASPRRLALDAFGNVFIASGSSVRRLTPAGVVDTPVGSGSLSDFRDGVGSSSRFSPITGIAVDGLGDLYLADSSNALIRKATLLGRKGARVANLSVRSSAGTGADTLIVGFNLTGASQSLLIRAIGPALASFGVGGALADPTLQLESGGTLVAQNNDWDSVAEGVAIRAAAAGVGAFALPALSKDAALLQSLSAGSFTAQIGGGTGVALVEVYDLARTNGGRLGNLSARTRAGAGADTLIVGFVIGGDTARTVLIRGIGPTLAAFGVTGTLAAPRLELYRDALLVEANATWGGSPALAAAFGQVGAFPLAADSRDAALLVTLLPGAYTAQVTGAVGAAGIVLVEIYDVP